MPSHINQSAQEPAPEKWQEIEVSHFWLGGGGWWYPCLSSNSGIVAGDSFFKCKYSFILILHSFTHHTSMKQRATSPEVLRESDTAVQLSRKG